MILEQRDNLSTPEVGFDYDLAIAGGGIVGVTLACALRNSGLRVVLIEARPQAVVADRNQAYAVSLLSGKIFTGIGVWDKILPNITTFSQIRLSDADYPGIVQFFPADLGTEALGYVGEHRVLLTALQEFLAECPDVSWLCPAEVVGVEYQEGGVEIAVRGEGISKIRTKLIVAADGARSPIRSAAGIKTKGWQYWQSCLTFRVKPENPHNNIAYERFWSSGPFAILPLPNNQCNVVWTAPHDEVKALAALDEKDFLTELQKRYGDQMGKVKLESPRSIFPVQLMQSDRYILPRLALIGDAAHCCHPVGGQGLNLGIRDAAALAQVLQSAHQQGQDIGNLTVLKSYERWRKLENWTILGFTDILDRTFSNNWLPLVVIRRIGLWMMGHIQPIKSLALRLMTGLLGRSPQLAQPEGRS